MSTQVEDYDVIILGTGLTEIILSSLLSFGGKKVLHLDRNAFYGGELPAMTPLNDFYVRFGRSEPPPDALGRGRDYIIDLSPKFFLGKTDMSRSMIKPLSRYLEFKSIDRSNILLASSIHAVTYDQKKVLDSSAMGMFEKRRLNIFIVFILDLRIDDPSTWKNINIDVQPMSDVYTQFGLDVISQQMIGHGLARYSTEDYKEHRAREVLERIKRCMDSWESSATSPYAYPRYSLGELPQAAPRFGALYGATWLQGVSIQSVQMDSADNKFASVLFDGRSARATHLVGDPSYFTSRVTKSAQVIRAICLLDQPIPNTKDAQSQLIVIPGPQVNRHNDIYVTCVSSTHMVSPAGKFIATISTTVESDNPEQEITPALNLLGPISNNAYFFQVSDVFEPIASAAEENIFISRSDDGTPHFDGIYDDVRRIYLGIMGKDLESEPVVDTPSE